MTLKQKCVAGLLWSCSIAGIGLLVWSGLENAGMMIAAAACLGVGFGGLSAYDAWGCARERQYHHALGFISGKKAAADMIECRKRG